MVKIFNLFPDRPSVPERGQENNNEKKENQPKIGGEESEDGGDDESTSVFRIDRQGAAAPEQQITSGYAEYFNDINRKLHAYAITSMDSGQYVKFQSLKNKIRNLEGKVSRSAYSEYYASLNNQSLSELLPILDNLNEQDFASRPAYALALFKVIEEKDLIEGVKKKKSEKTRKDEQE